MSTKERLEYTSIDEMMADFVGQVTATNPAPWTVSEGEDEEGKYARVLDAKQVPVYEFRKPWRFGGADTARRICELSNPIAEANDKAIRRACMATHIVNLLGQYLAESAIAIAVTEEQKQAMFLVTLLGMDDFENNSKLRVHLEMAMEMERRFRRGEKQP